MNYAQQKTIFQCGGGIFINFGFFMTATHVHNYLLEAVILKKNQWITKLRNTHNGEHDWGKQAEQKLFHYKI